MQETGRIIRRSSSPGVPIRVRTGSWSQQWQSKRRTTMQRTLGDGRQINLDLGKGEHIGLSACKRAVRAGECRGWVGWVGVTKSAHCLAHTDKIKG
jgi:hypothetical protein